jgi:hypothetical protein
VRQCLKHTMCRRAGAVVVRPTCIAPSRSDDRSCPWLFPFNPKQRRMIRCCPLSARSCSAATMSTNQCQWRPRQRPEAKVHDAAVCRGVWPTPPHREIGHIRIRARPGRFDDCAGYSVRSKQVNYTRQSTGRLPRPDCGRVDYPRIRRSAWQDEFAQSRRTCLALFEALLILNVGSL